MDTILLSTAYFPNIQYVSKLLLGQPIRIEANETFLKQSYRNRCTIATANGPADLCVPVKKPNGNKTITKDILVDYDTKWQQDHWRAIVSAYGNSPFFEVLEPEFAPIFEKKEKYLLDLNVNVLNLLFLSLGHIVQLELTDHYVVALDGFIDYRNSIHPKKRMRVPDPRFSAIPYHQVFAQKHGFLDNLSFLDLLFNEGPQAIRITKCCITPNI